MNRINKTYKTINIYSWMYVQVRADLQTQPFRYETLFSFELVKFDKIDYHNFQ